MSERLPPEQLDGRYCNAWNPKRLKHCGSPAGAGTDHKGHGPCFLHSGRTPAHKTAAKRRAARELGMELAALRDDVVTPEQALDDQLQFQARLVVVLRTWVQELTFEEVTGPVGNPDQVMRHEPHVLIQWRGVEEDRLLKIAKTHGDAGVAERAIRVVEENAAEIAAVLRRFAVLAGLDLATPVVQQAARLALTQDTNPPTIEGARTAPRPNEGGDASGTS